MKKSLIALAVLAASGASFAQSSVTIYGIADVWFGTTSGTNKPSQTVLESGGVSTSRWGLKGSEDLGGGLKANFLLEQGFKLDTGAVTDTTAGAFGRYAYVGFSGGFGEVRLGKVGTAYDDLNGNGHDVWDSALSSNNGVWQAYAGTGNNEIYYATNNYNGFSGAVSYALGENKTNATTATTGQVGDGSASSITSLNVKYAAGPLYVGLGYQVEKAQGGVILAAVVPATTPATFTQTPTSDLKSTRLNASYDFGVAKLVADIGHVTLGNQATNQWTLGGYVPVSTALSFSAGYSKGTDNDAAGNDTRKGYGLGALYVLSKRTSLYAGFNHNTTTDGVTSVETTNKTTAVGVIHNF